MREIKSHIYALGSRRESYISIKQNCIYIVHNVLTSQIRYEMFSVQKRTAAQLKVCFAVIRSLNFLLTKTAAGLQIPWRLIGQMKRFEFLILQSAQWHCSLSTVSHLLGAILSGSRF